MKKDRVSILEDIGKLITKSARPHRTLEKIVELVAGKFNIDVCSVYLLDTDKQSLVLQATVGLRKESTGRVQISIHEGLTGLVLEKMLPVFVVNPATHPIYKFFEKSGEEIYSTYLGVPLVHLRSPLGVLEDMGKRVLRKLLGYEGQENRQFERETVVIASDISPIDLIGLRQDNLKGIVLFKILYNVLFGARTVVGFLTFAIT